MGMGCEDLGLLNFRMGVVAWRGVATQNVNGRNGLMGLVVFPGSSGIPGLECTDTSGQTDAISNQFFSIELKSVREKTRMCARLGYI